MRVQIVLDQIKEIERVPRKKPIKIILTCNSSGLKECTLCEKHF